jgi:hypothetical protein
MGVNGLMQFLRKQIPGAFHSKPQEKLTGTAFVDTPLITMSCGMVAQASHATIDPYALVSQKLSTIEHLLKIHGAKEVKFVFDGPTRKEKIGTCVKRAESIRKQSEKRKRDYDSGTLPPVYRIEEDSEPEDSRKPILMAPSGQLVADTDMELLQGAAHINTNPCSVSEEVPMELFHDEGFRTQPTSSLKIFSGVTMDHCLESDLYISSMIAHGSDTFVLKDLARYAKLVVGTQALQAPHDSESYIASLVKKGDVGVTCDSDALPFGCEWTVQNIGTAKETWIKLDDILRGLDMTLHEFRVFCVLLGTDFNERLYLCGPTKSFPAVKNGFTSFESFCMLHGKKYSAEEKQAWITSAENSLLVFSSEKP